MNMAIGSVSFPQPQAYSGGADFTPLANLGNVYQQAQARDRQLAALARLGTDPTANAAILMQSGDPTLVGQGMTAQGQQADRAERMREFQAQQAIRQSQERRAQQTFEEDSVEGRTAKLVGAGLDPNDPLNRAYVATGQNPPDVIKQAAEKRAQTTFEQGQATATPEGRRQTAVTQGYDLKDPGVRNWILTGQNLPDLASAGKAGLSPSWGTRKDPVTGQDVPVMLQTTGTGEAIETKLPPGVTVSNKPIVVNGPTMDTLLDPVTHQIIGQIPKDVAGHARQQATGEATGKAEVALPDTLRTTDALIENIDGIINHEAKSYALGKGQYIPDVLAAGTKLADFRARVAQLGGQAMSQNMALLRGSGLGAVSDFEQKNMINGFVRASQAQTQEGFDAAMNDARKSAIKIRDIARGRAKGDFSGGETKPTSTGATDWQTYFGKK